MGVHLVETTHYNLAANVTQLYAADPGTYTESERFLAMLPMYHVYGCLWFIFMSRGFSRHAFARLIMIWILFSILQDHDCHSP